MKKEILEIKDVFKPGEEVSREVVRDTFINGMSQFWEHAKIAYRVKLQEALFEARENFFKSLDGILSRKFIETENLNRKTLEQFNQYRDKDWTKKEILDEIDKKIKIMVDAVRSEPRKIL